MKSLLAGLVLASSVVVAVGAASPATALSCVGPQMVLDRAETIYAGQIVDFSDDEVTFEIDEVWRGTPPPARVTYDIDLPQWWETDEGKESGKRVVFAPAEGAVNPCTVFPRGGEMADEIEAFRPASPALPTESTVIDKDLPAQSAVPGWMYVGGAALAVSLVGVAFVALRRRSPVR